MLPENVQFHFLMIGYRQALSLLLLALAIISIQTSLNLFGNERQVFWRESRHYSIFAYLVGKSLAQLPITCALPFFYTLFSYQLLRPYAPFQSVYLIFLLMQWVGEGWGQLISLQLNSSRQLAGGVIALLSTVVSGSFPLLGGMGIAFNAVSYLSFVRWGMVALLSVEFAPWYSGEPMFTKAGGAHLGCCALPPGFLANATVPHGRMPASLPSKCSGSTSRPPNSQHDLDDVMRNQYGYTAWFEPLFRMDWANTPTAAQGAPPSPPIRGLPIDLYPLPGSDAYLDASAGSRTSAPGFSNSALCAMVAIGIGVRFLVYLSLRFMDRGRRR